VFSARGHHARTPTHETVLDCLEAGIEAGAVVGDDPSVVASGPTAPDSTTFETALTTLERYDVTVPASVQSYLERGVEGAVPETPGPDSAVFDRVHTHILASGETAVGAAAQRASARGYPPLVLSTRMRGEARESALAHVAIAEECLAAGQPVEPPAVLLSGGETTVTVRSDGTGGPNQEFALSAGRQLPEGIVLGSVDTGATGTNVNDLRVLAVEA